mmetsp:Transcript_14963/g.30235  ORF Transcript_14963/g.30235 Transcript_14963/m.30235 type:complete len:82 (+) Transcript_14963:1053-1298(+)
MQAERYEQTNEPEEGLPRRSAEVMMSLVWHIFLFYLSIQRPASQPTIRRPSLHVQIRKKKKKKSPANCTRSATTALTMTED